MCEIRRRRTAGEKGKRRLLSLRYVAYISFEADAELPLVMVKTLHSNVSGLRPKVCVESFYCKILYL